MAFWNTRVENPDHATHAVRAALDMVAAVRRFNARFTTGAAHPDGTSEVRFGIGLATGECCVGNFGSAQRFDHSALGESVNIAARLQSATKYYRADILASEGTVRCTPDFAWLELDQVRVNGRSEVSRVFALIGDEAVRASEDFGAWADLHAHMLTAYRNADFDAAGALALQARERAAPRQQAMYEELQRRCGALARTSRADWSAITVLEQP